MSKPKIFISYRREDEPWAAQVIQMHLKHYRCEVFLDVNMKGGIKWDKEIALTMYDEIANQVNESFPDFMKEFLFWLNNNGQEDYTISFGVACNCAGWKEETSNPKLQG